MAVTILLFCCQSRGSQNRAAVSLELEMEGRSSKMSEHHSRQVSGKGIVLLPACRRCNGKRGTLYPCAGKIVACSPAFGEEIQPRREFPRNKQVTPDRLPCQQGKEGDDSIRIEFGGKGKGRYSQTFYRSDIAVHIDALTLGRHERRAVNTMVLQRPPLCLHCRQGIDLTGAKTLVIVPQRGLLCDVDCETGFLEANPHWREMLASLKPPTLVRL